MVSGKVKSPYQILGIAPSATAEQIRAAHRKLALKWHPDRAKGKAQRAKHQTRMAAVNAARDALLTKSGELRLLPPGTGFGRTRDAGRGTTIIRNMRQTIFDRTGRQVGSVEVLYAEATNAAMHELLEQVANGESINLGNIFGAGISEVLPKGKRRSHVRQ